MTQTQIKPWIPALAALLFLAVGTARADDVVIDIIGGIEGAIPVAVVPFRGDRESERLGVDVAEIIAADLARSGRFDILPREEVISAPDRLEAVRFSRWRALGVDHLVVGEMRSIGDGRHEVRYELLDVYQGRRVEGRRFRADQRHLRVLAHTIADAVFEELTGIPGAFATRIAYVAVEEDGDGRKHRLVVADADGYRPQTILTSREPLISPAWSPDRERLAYVSFEGRRSEVFVQHVATGERQRVASFEGINSAPAWSPDGSRLAVTLSRGGSANIYVIELRNGAVTRLTDHWAIDTEAAWSPDGRWIYFTSDRGGRPQIYRMPSRGGRAERITYDGGYNARPTLSPDGEHMAMVHGRDGRYYIAVMDMVTEEVRVVSHGPYDESPSFAPNGVMVIYTAGGAGDSRLHTASLQGGAVAPIRGGEDENIRVREPAW